MSEIVSLLGIPCPENAARALLTLAISESGTETLFDVDNGEPLRNLLEALSLEGFHPTVISTTETFSRVRARTP